MGIRKSIKKRLPIFGAGGSAETGAPPAVERPAAPAAPPAATAAPEPAKADMPVGEFIDELVKTNPIVIFMKGSPSQPQCGFSANASAILKTYGKPLAHFDVLSDPEVRQGVKEYSQWPTLPQIYVGGEFLGGSDILMQMHQAGELKEVIEEACAES